MTQISARNIMVKLNLVFSAYLEENLLFYLISFSESIKILYVDILANF